MTSENVDSLRRGFEAFARGDIDAVEEVIDPEFEIENSILIDALPSVRGVAALQVNTDKVREAFGDFTWKPQEIIEVGDRILVRVHIAGEGRSTALPMEQLSPNLDIGHLWTLRDGRAISLRIFRTWDEARAAAGLRD